MRNANVVGLLALVCLSTAARAEDLTIGTSADYPPWESVDGASKVVGFEPDVGAEMCKRMKVTCTFANQAYDGLLPALSIGKLNMVMAAVNATPARLEKVDFSTRYARATSRFVSGKAGPFKADLDAAALKAALAGKTVGVQSGSSQLSVMTKYYPDATVREYERADQMFEDLNSGRVDAIFLIETAAADTLSNELGKSDQFVGPSFSGSEYPELGNGIGVVMAKGNAALQARVDEAIGSMKKDGTIKALSEKWFHKDISL